MVVNIIKACYRVILLWDFQCFITVPPLNACGRRIGVIAAITRQISRRAADDPADYEPTLIGKSLPTKNNQALLRLQSQSRINLKPTATDYKRFFLQYSEWQISNLSCKFL